MDKSLGYALLTVPKVIAMSSKKKDESSLRSLITNLLGVWGFKKVPYELKIEFRQLNRQKLIDNPHIYRLKVSFIYYDALLMKKADYIELLRPQDQETIPEKAICCFLYSFTTALKGFPHQNCMMNFPYDIIESINYEFMKDEAMLWSGITSEQGYHPIIWGLGYDFSDINLATEILDARIRYTKQYIRRFYYLNNQIPQETTHFLYGMLFDLGMFYAYKEIELALVQGSFNRDYMRMIKSFD